MTDHIAFPCLSQGGGGGSNPLKVVLSVAVSAFGIVEIVQSEKIGK